MKKAGKFLAAVLFAVFAFGTAQAQDLAQASELYNNAAKALNEGNNTAALDGFQKALNMALSLGEEGTALATDAKAIIPKILLQIGKEEASNKNLDGAVAKLKEAVAKATEYNQPEVAKEAKELIPNVLITDGNNLLNAGKMAEAAAEYKKALAEDPDNGVAYLRLGQALSASDEAASIEALTKAMGLGQEANAKKLLLNTYAKKALAAYKAKNNEQVLENALKAGEYGENANVSKLGGIAAFNLKKNTEAVEMLKKAEAADAKDMSVKYYLARAYEAAGNNAQACTYYKAIVNEAQFKAFATAKVSALCK